MSLQMLSRHFRPLRRAVASPAPCCRPSGSARLLQGGHVLFRGLLVFSSCLSQGEELLRTPLRRSADSASCRLQAEAAPSSNAQPTQDDDIMWKGCKTGTDNLAMVLPRVGSSASRAKEVFPSLPWQVANRLLQSRLQLNFTGSLIFRTVHSAAGHDDEESDDFDDFFLEPEAVKSTGRSSKKGRANTQKIFESEEEDEVPIITTKKRKASVIDACEDSDVEEDVGFTPSGRILPGISAKKKRSYNDKNITESRGSFIKKRPIALENSPEEKPNSSGRDSSEITPVHGSDAIDNESEAMQAGPSNKSTDLNATSEESSSGPSHLTNTRFDKFPISSLSIKALHSVLKYERMTAVQEATLPIILRGQDVLAKARTGTGKTIAFLLPAIEAILKAPTGRDRNPIYVLIVCPTRELAQQAAAEAKVLLQFHRGLGAQVVYGGCSIRGEQNNLSRSPCQILVGTPGRLVDHIQRTPAISNQLKAVRLFVLDEADHMLDMGFRDSLQKIMQAIPSKRQTLLFSATIPKEVHSMAKIALRNDHVYIDTVGKESQDTHANVKQQYIVAPLEKHIRVLYVALMQHMESNPHYKVLAFCSTARVTGFMCKLFMNLGFNAREIHSRKDQSYRTRVSDEFRHSKGGIILFTSDVSARGVDYPNVTLVVQVGAPSEFEQYIHRLGRTGRAGKAGEGLLILAPWEDYFLQKLAKLPMVQLPPPKLTSQAKAKILSAASCVDESLKEMAYTAWLGYYKSLKGLALDKVMLVEYANQFSASMGFDEPPALSRMIVSKMALTGVPGLRLKR